MHSCMKNRMGTHLLFVSSTSIILKVLSVKNLPMMQAALRSDDSYVPARGCACANERLCGGIIRVHA